MIVLDKVAAVARELQDRSLPALASPDGPSGLDCAGKLLQPQQVLLRASWLCQPWLPAPWQGAASAHFQIPWTAPQLLPSPSSCPPPPAAQLIQGYSALPRTQTTSFPPLFFPLLFSVGWWGGGVPLSLSSLLFFLAGILSLACGSFPAQGVGMYNPQHSDSNLGNQHGPPQLTSMESRPGLDWHGFSRAHQASASSWEEGWKWIK